MNGGRKFVVHLCFILHSSLADFLKLQLLLLIVHRHCPHSTPTPPSCLQVYQMAIAKLIVALTRRLGGRSMTLLVRLLSARGIRGYYGYSFS